MLVRPPHEVWQCRPSGVPWARVLSLCYSSRVGRNAQDVPRQRQFSSAMAVVKAICAVALISSKHYPTLDQSQDACARPHASYVSHLPDDASQRVNAQGDSPSVELLTIVRSW